MQINVIIFCLLLKKLIIQFFSVSFLPKRNEKQLHKLTKKVKIFRYTFVLLILLLNALFRRFS